MEEAPTFGALISHYRVAVGLTQEELAERAQLSARGISDLERGVRTRPQPLTVRHLAEALQLAPHDRAIFEDAARTARAARTGEEVLPEGSFLGARPSGGLVAREDEVARMRAILAAVAEGAGQVLMLSGELGVGKTRLLQELMIEARDRGYLVLTGRCTAAEQAPASVYGPFLDALSGLPPRLPARARSEGLRIWKRIQQVTRATATAQDAEMVEQRALVEAVRDLLLLGARSAPLALLLDDLQWADRASLTLLPHLARATRGAPILLAAAFRDLRLVEEHPPLAHALQTLSRERLAERITVRRLSLEETTALVATTMGQDAVSEEFASFVYRRTKGIPRLVDQLVRSLGGRLELQGEIGAGAMGRVFRAFDRTTQHTVAAKLVLARAEIDLDALLRFQHEGAVLATLNHPHIVRIYDTFTEEHASCIVMELLDGPSLGQILQDGPLPLPRARRLARQVAEALAYAHGQRIVHRDIKPDNVMVLDGDQVKVTDFGIARILQPDTSLQTIATTGMRLGTPLYMAPEQIEGKAVDGRTDVYAFGCMFYHMVTGQPPFAGSDALAVAVKHLQEEPPAPSALNPAVPAEWDTVIRTALAKDPARRYQSAGELERAVAALGKRAVAPAHAQTRSRAWASLLAHRRSAPIGVTAAVGVLLVATAIVLWTHAPTAARSSGLSARLDAYLSGLAARGQLSGTVLVARKGAVLLSKGYGLADRAQRVANTPDTRYAVALNTTSMIPAALILEEQGKLADNAPICRYLTSCPAAWRPITLRMVLDGTSRLPHRDVGREPGVTTAQTLRALQTQPLDGSPGSAIDYQNGDGVVLGAIIERVTGEPYATFVRQAILGPAGMAHSGRLLGVRRPPRWAQVYAGASDDGGWSYDDAFFLYATSPDTYAFDNALFGGRLLSARNLRRLLTPRTPILPADPGVGAEQQAYIWRMGRIDGHRVACTLLSNTDYYTANVRFVDDGVTIVVLSNDTSNDAEGVAIHLAGLVFGPTIAPVAVAQVAPAAAIVATLKVPHAFGITSGDKGALWAGGNQTGMVTRIDPATNRIVATTRINDPATAGGLIDAGIVIVASGSGQVWATDRVHRAVVRIDPATNRVVARVPVGIEPFSLAMADDILWVDDSYEDEPGVNTIVRVDMRTQKVVATISNASTDLGQPFLVLAATPDALWYADWAGGTIKRLDAATNKVVATIHAGLQPTELVLGVGALWTANHFSNLVTRIDLRTNKVVARIPLNGYPGGQISGDCCGGTVTVGAGAVWALAGSGQRTLVRIDPQTDRVTSALTFPQGLGTLTVAEGSVWVAGGDGTSYYRINPQAML